MNASKNTNKGILLSPRERQQYQAILASTSDEIEQVMQVIRTLPHETAYAILKDYIRRQYLAGQISCFDPPSKERVTMN